LCSEEGCGNKEVSYSGIECGVAMEEFSDKRLTLPGQQRIS